MKFILVFLIIIGAIYCDSCDSDYDCYYCCTDDDECGTYDQCHGGKSYWYSYVISFIGFMLIIFLIVYCIKRRNMARNKRFMQQQQARQAQLAAANNQDPNDQFNQNQFSQQQYNQMYQNNGYPNNYNSNYNNNVQMFGNVDVQRVPMQQFQQYPNQNQYQNNNNYQNQNQNQNQNVPIENIYV